ncbi:MAG: response regulator [Alphaproteobacteria bacterium]
MPSAHTALAALKQTDHAGRGIQVAIIDQMMPEIDGITLRRMIREDPSFNHIKLIISSSAGITYDQEACQLGFDAALPKPVLQERLLQTIHTLLNLQDVEGADSSENIGADHSNHDAPIGDAQIPEADADHQPIKAVSENHSADAGGANVASAEQKPAAPPHENGKPRILLAEDNSANQQLIIAMLENSGYCVDVVADGVEAVQAAQSLPYDLILMDIRMPVMGGIEAVQRIKAINGESGACPIIAMTANAMKGNREEYLAAGMTDYISKPVDMRTLIDKLRSYLGEQWTRSTSPNIRADAKTTTATSATPDTNAGTGAVSTPVPHAKTG